MPKKQVNTTFWQTSTHIAFKWEMKSEDLWDLQDGYWIDSASFSLFNEKWYLQITRLLSEFKVSVILEKKEDHAEHRVSFSLSVNVGENFVKKGRNDYLYESGLGYRRVLPILTVLASVIEEDKNNEFPSNVKIECTVRSLFFTMNEFLDMETTLLNNDSVTSVSPTISLCNNNNSEITQATRISPIDKDTKDFEKNLKKFQSLAESFEDLLLSKELTDVTIKVGEQEFQAHRAILAAQVPYILSVFKDQMNQNLDSISLECDPDSFGDFLKIVYSGKTEYVTPANAVGLFKTAKECHLKNLQNVCREHISKALTTDNLCDVLILSVDYEDGELLNVTTNFFIEHVDEIIKTQQWQMLWDDKKTKHVLRELFSKYVEASKSRQNV